MRSRPNDLTFRIRKGFRIPEATSVRIECYENRNQNHPYDTVVIGPGVRSGLKLYNSSRDGDHTLSHKRNIREGIIEYNNLSAGMEIPGTLTVQGNGTHLYKLFIEERVNV